MSFLTIRWTAFLTILVLAFGFAGNAMAGETNEAAEEIQLTLNEQLQEIREGSQPPPEVMEVIGKSMQELRDAKVVEKAVQQGGVSPNFELPLGTDKVFELDQALESGPVVLMFVRGGW